VEEPEGRVGYPEATNSGSFCIPSIGKGVHKRGKGVMRKRMDMCRNPGKYRRTTSLCLYN